MELTIAISISSFWLLDLLELALDQKGNYWLESGILDFEGKKEEGRGEKTSSKMISYLSSSIVGKVLPLLLMVILICSCQLCC